MRAGPQGQRGHLARVSTELLQQVLAADVAASWAAPYNRATAALSTSRARP
ncbi:hypothetical protein ABZ092_23970 [Streptomyces bobili]|uniref:hypothetical protein n=1 Tax=Streptomyces bobili TaxID=67280 RepID=UPI0033AED459